MNKKVLTGICISVGLLMAAAGILITLWVCGAGPFKQKEDKKGGTNVNNYDSGTELSDQSVISNLLADGTVLEDVRELVVSKNKAGAKIMTDGATGRFFIASAYGGRTALNASQIGITLESTDFTGGMSYVPASCKMSSGTDSYTLTTGPRKEVGDEYNEMSFDLQKDGKILKVVVRAYERGIAYRYILSGANGETANVKSEASEFVLPDDAVLWTGFDGAGNYEYHYSKINMSSVKVASAKYSTPLLANSGDVWMLYTEAAVFSGENTYCASELVTKQGSTNLHLEFGKGSASTINIKYGADGTFHTPWRVVVEGNTLDDIVGSTVVTSLNPKADDALFADIKDWGLTGKVAWSWWSEAGDDPVEYAQQKDYIDFAAQNGWEYVCIDFGWCLWSDYKTKVKELVDYGKEKNVAIILWYGVNNDNHGGFKDASGAAAYPKYSVKNAAQLEEQFSWCNSIGVRGVKVDYFEQDDAGTMELMHNVAAIAAKYKLNVLFHGCTSPKGEHRTFPNIVSYEAVLGGEGYKWNNGASISDSLILMFSRNVVGGMDFTPIGTKVTQLDMTAGFALAQLVTYQSGFVNVASSVYKLEGYGGLAYINDVPVTWDETRVVDGYPGLYCTIARRNGEDWYIGTMTASKKEAAIPLDFLGDGEYTAYIYEDNEKGTEVVLRTEKVTKKSSLKLNLMTDGGAAVKISKTGMKTGTAYDGYQFYEAEDAGKTDGNASINVNQFASGMKQVINIGGTLSDTLTFDNIRVNSAGVYEMRLYFACGIEKRIEYAINGKERIRSTGLNSGVNTLGMKVFYVELNEGNNKIVFGNSFGSAPNIDRIAISSQPVNKEATGSDETGIDANISAGAKYKYTAYGPESATLAGGAKIENGGIGWLGNSASCTASFTVKAEKAGKYKLQIKYYTGETRSLYVGVNGAAGEKLECKNTGSYGIDSASYEYMDVELKSGDNTIVLNNASGWCPNIAGIGISTTVVE